MKAPIYEGPGEKSWTDVPDPKIQNPSDVIVRVDTTTIWAQTLRRPEPWPNGLKAAS